ncbi:MAG: ABC transporter ATP-binding protein [Planctomycetes bacterium]|nr:ABC transporter ATP-binding protein [Planctomycetota bacterium]
MGDLDPSTLWTSIGGALAVAAAVFFGPSLVRRGLRGDDDPRGGRAPGGGASRSRVRSRAARAHAGTSNEAAPGIPGPETVARDRRGVDRRPAGDVLVALRGVTRVYPDADGVTITALGGVDLEVREGEMLGVIGPSGLGKSTLLNILGGIDFPTRGELSWRGVALPGCESPAIRAHRARAVCFVFQDLNLVTHLTAEENAALPLLCQGVARREALGAARVQLEALGLGRLLHRRAHQLSGGQRQRVAIARAFASRAPLLLADEPTGSLDPETAQAVMDAFATRARHEGRTVVLVTHDPALARRTCDRVLLCSPHGLRDVTDGDEASALRAEVRPAATNEVGARPRADTGATRPPASGPAPPSSQEAPSPGARAHVARGRAR